MGLHSTEPSYKWQYYWTQLHKVLNCGTQAMTGSEHPCYSLHQWPQPETRILKHTKPKLRAGREGEARRVFLAAVHGEVAKTRVFSTGTSNPRGSQHAPQMPNHIRKTG